MTTLKQMNVWTVQEQLSQNQTLQKQLDIKLKVLRDQYMNQRIDQCKIDQRIGPTIAKRRKKSKCDIL